MQMESNRKRRGFMKGKLAIPFYRQSKPSSTTMQYSSKVKPSTPPLSAAASVGFIVKQDCAITPQPKQKVSFVRPDNGHDSYAAKFDNFYGVAADDSVDTKAATYISCVQERFRLERVNSDRQMSQDTF